MTIHHKQYYLTALALLVIGSIFSACSKDPVESTINVSEKQYLVFDQINKQSDPIIVGDVFLTKSDNQTKIRFFYYNEDPFKVSRPISIFKGDVLSGGTEKIMDLPALPGPKASYSEAIWNIPYEQAIQQSAHIIVYKKPVKDSVLAVADLGPNGFKGTDFNMDYPFLGYKNAISSGKISLWQRRNDSYFLKVSIDTMLVGKKYVADIYEGDTSKVGGRKWLSIGEIPNIKPGQKYKAINVTTKADGTKLSSQVISQADAHIEVRMMPDNVIVCKGVFGKNKE